MELLTIILTSTLIAGIVSAVANGWFGLRGRQDEYKNAYYKLILERRLAAYEEVEKLIASIKVAVIDKDHRPYHLLFSKDLDEVGVYATMHGTMSSALWLSDNLFDLTRELNVLVFQRTKALGLVEFGKQNYRALGELRTKIEKAHLRDLLTLHDVRGFLRSKRPADSYTEPKSPSAV